MGVNVEIVPASTEAAVELAANMRAADAAEVAASHGLDPLSAVVHSMTISAEAWAVYFNGKIACVWGVCPLRDGLLTGRVGSVWMLSAKTVERFKVTFFRWSRKILAAALDRWDELVNVVDARYHRAIKWGARLGFVYGEPVRFGPSDFLFVPFRVTKESLWARR